MDSRSAFDGVVIKQKEYEDQSKVVEEARKVFETAGEELKVIKTKLQSAWIDLERATNHALLYSVDGVVYMRWTGHNGYPEPKLVPVNGFVIPPSI